MAQDIIAESETERVLSTLERGDADDKVRDRVSAALLRALTRMSTELADIRENLWKPDDLRRVIDERHDQKCRECPAKKLVDESLHAATAPKRDQPQGMIPWLINLMSNNSFQFFILLLFLIAAFVYLTTGKGGVDAARETLSTVVSGGAK